MMTNDNLLETPNPCPSAEQWSAFRSGRLPGLTVEDMAGHLEWCVACAALLDTLPDSDDPLLADLRQPESADDLGPEEARQAVAVVERLTPAVVQAEASSAPAGAKSSWAGGLAKGDCLGPYCLQGLLGKGGMGQVFKAEDTHLGRTVAVKVIAARHLGDAAAVARFRQEMQTQARLCHQNIAQAFHADLIGDTPYLVMEYVEGINLDDLVRERGPLPVGEACAYAAQVADGLAYAQQFGLVHRDIKPNNLIRGNRSPDGAGGGFGPVKVLDFGLARLGEGPAGGVPLTETGQILGTPEFMAPEQWQHTRGADTRSDLYSLGCTLFYLLTGKPPYSRQDYPGVPGLWYAHETAPVPSARALRPEVPEALDAVLGRLLAKEPADRYATPAEARDALAAFSGGAVPAAPAAPQETRAAQPMAPAATPVPEETVSVVPAARRSRGRRWLLAASLVVLLLAGWRWGWPALHLGQVPTAGGPAGEPVQIASFQVGHFRGDPPVYLGDVGPLSTQTWANDDVQVLARLSRPAYFYLLAFLPKGKVEPCFPKDPEVAPPLLADLVYPLKENVLYGLTDGVGLEAFALFVSAEPLPPYAEWQRSNPLPPWKTVAAEEGVWWGDEKPLRLHSKKYRGERVKIPPPPEVTALYQFFRQRRGVGAMQLVAFPVVEKP
jgi:hypothetical protein